MNLLQFCENRYQELALQAQAKPDYDCQVDAEIGAVQKISQTSRVLLKWAFIPVALYSFIRVVLEMDPEPEPVLMNKAKAKREQEREEKKNPLSVAPPCESI